MGRLSVFSICSLFVAAVSVHDAMLVVLNQSVIVELEQNPIGSWLLQIHGGEVGLFVIAKLSGTAFVCALLIEIYRRSKGFGLAIAVPLATFQMWLLCYLTV